MYFSLLAVFLGVCGSANAGLLIHDEHPHEVLENIHNTPRCAYPCIFDQSYQSKWARRCTELKPGMEAGPCYCLSHAYQYIVDQCYERKCSTDDRKKVHSFFLRLTLGERYEREELRVLRCGENGDV
jgi:hypothetical protein